jgi:hypothetical protein
MISLIGLIAYGALCYIVGTLGKDKTFGLWGTTAISFLFTPIVGLLVVLASEKKPAVVITAS